MPVELTLHELSLLARRDFEQLGHDTQHRIFKFFAWDETKSKASHGGYVDLSKLAGAKLEKMTTAEVGKLLMTCAALASDLYCPTYNPGTAPS